MGSQRVGAGEEGVEATLATPLSEDEYQALLDNISQTCPGERKSGKIADTPVELLNEGLWVWDRGKRLCKLEGRGRL